MAEEWNRKIDEIENRIADRRKEIEILIEKAKETNLEINHWKVLSQTSSYKYEYELSLKDMYDTHQYETRLRRLGGEIDNS